MLTHNPDIILCLYPSDGHHARTTVASRMGWQTLRAVQNGRVYDDFNLDTILRPGPPDFAEEAGFAAAIRGLYAAGLRDFAFYNYGHVRRSNLEWIGRASAGLD